METKAEYLQLFNKSCKKSAGLLSVLYNFLESEGSKAWDDDKEMAKQLLELVKKIDEACHPSDPTKIAEAFSAIPSELKLLLAALLLGKLRALDKRLRILRNSSKEDDILDCEDIEAAKPYFSFALYSVLPQRKIAQEWDREARAILEVGTNIERMLSNRSNRSQKLDSLVQTWLGALSSFATTCAAFERNGDVAELASAVSALYPHIHGSEQLAAFTPFLRLLLKSLDKMSQSLAVLSRLESPQSLSEALENEGDDNFASLAGLPTKVTFRLPESLISDTKAVALKFNVPYLTIASAA